MHHFFTMRIDTSLGEIHFYEGMFIVCVFCFVIVFPWSHLHHNNHVAISFQFGSAKCHFRGADPSGEWLRKDAISPLHKPVIFSFLWT